MSLNPKNSLPKHWRNAPNMSATNLSAMHVKTPFKTSPQENPKKVKGEIFICI
jgi:hypothetical protein